MMSPALAAEFGTGEGMAEVPLIHQDDIRFLSPAVDWPAWFAQAGLPERNWTGQRFSQADHALDAALSGAGAVLGRGSLTNRMLREGRLVAPFRPRDGHAPLLRPRRSCPLQEPWSGVERRLQPASPCQGIA